MVSIASVINTPPVANATLPTQPVAVVDRVSTRVTPVAVAAPLNSERVADNSSGREARQVLTRVTLQPVTGSAVTTPLPSGDSSAFLTQLLSQASTASLAAAQSYSRFAPAVQYNTLVSYSFVKYKPSNAGIPAAKTPGSDAAFAGGSQSALQIANEYQAYNNAQIRIASEQSTASVPVVVSG